MIYFFSHTISLPLSLVTPFNTHFLSLPHYHPFPLPLSIKHARNQTQGIICIECGHLKVSKFQSNFQYKKSRISNKIGLFIGMSLVCFLLSFSNLFHLVNCIILRSPCRYFTMDEFLSDKNSYCILSTSMTKS